MGVGKHSCLVVTTEHLDFVAVAATAEQELSIGRDIKLTWPIRVSSPVLLSTEKIAMPSAFSRLLE